MEDAIPSKSVDLTCLALLRESIVKAEALVPERVVDDVLAVYDLDVLGLIHYLVLASFLIFLVNYDEHAAQGLLQVRLALHLQVLGLVHDLSQQNSLLQVQPIHLLLKALLSDVRMDFERELIDFRNHEGRRPVVLLCEEHVLLHG